MLRRRHDDRPQRPGARHRGRHGGDTSTVKKTAPVSLTARSTSDSASAPMPVPLEARRAHAAEATL
jgi:hypothetical protein